MSRKTGRCKSPSLQFYPFYPPEPSLLSEDTLKGGVATVTLEMDKQACAFWDFGIRRLGLETVATFEARALERPLKSPKA